MGVYSVVDLRTQAFSLEMIRNEFKHHTDKGKILT